jgi:hypothetical protein
MPYTPAPMQMRWHAGSGIQYPGKIQAIAIIQTVIGSLEILLSIFWFFYILLVGLATFGIGLLLLPVPLVVVIIGILSLVSGIKGLNKKISRKLSLGVAISQMVLLLMCDVLSFAAGLTGVILLTQDDTKAFFNQSGS